MTTNTSNNGESSDTEQQDTEGFAELTAMEEEMEAEKRAALEEIAEFSVSPPSDLSRYQDRFADGLPSDFTPEVVEFFDARNRLSHWFPRPRAARYPNHRHPDPRIGG